MAGEPAVGLRLMSVEVVEGDVNLPLGMRWPRSALAQKSEVTARHDEVGFARDTGRRLTDRLSALKAVSLFSVFLKGPAYNSLTLPETQRSH